MTKEEAVARIKDHIEIHRYYERNAVKIFEAFDMAIKALTQPEIIRCKDCKHYAEFRVKIQNVEQRTGWCERELNYFNVEPDDFCSKGEKKEEGDECPLS